MFKVLTRYFIVSACFATFVSVGNASTSVEVVGEKVSCTLGVPDSRFPDSHFNVTYERTYRFELSSTNLIDCKAALGDRCSFRLPAEIAKELVSGFRFKAGDNNGGWIKAGEYDVQAEIRMIRYSTTEPAFIVVYSYPNTSPSEDHDWNAFVTNTKMRVQMNLIRNAHAAKCPIITP